MMSSNLATNNSRKTYLCYIWLSESVGLQERQVFHKSVKRERVNILLVYLVLLDHLRIYNFIIIVFNNQTFYDVHLKDNITSKILL